MSIGLDVQVRDRRRGVRQDCKAVPGSEIRHGRVDRCLEVQRGVEQQSPYQFFGHLGADDQAHMLGVTRELESLVGAEAKAFGPERVENLAMRVLA